MVASSAVMTGPGEIERQRGDAAARRRDRAQLRIDELGHRPRAAVVGGGRARVVLGHRRGQFDALPGRDRRRAAGVDEDGVRRGRIAVAGRVNGVNPCPRTVGRKKL